MTWGVRTRITVLATLVVLVVLTATAASLVAGQRIVLTDNVDEVLERHSAEIADAIDAGGLAPTISGQGDDEAFAQVFDQSGALLAATAHTVDLPFDVPARPSLQSYTSAADGVEYRVLSEEHGDFLIRTGTPLDDVNDSVATLTGGLVIAVPAAGILLAVAIWYLVGRVLRPVERIREQVAAITGTSLDRRVPEPASGDEIARLARTMNEMLQRVEASSERQRRFVADASHELRSPLTRMRAELEVDLAHPESADLEATHRSVLDDARTMQGLLDDLLTLARSDGNQHGRREPVDLDDIVLREVQALASGDRAVDVSGVSGAQVIGDGAQLARVVRNLLENAVRHGGGTIAVTLREDGDSAELSVADNGAGVPEALRERIFERFARVDEARARTDGGAGLGLAIARELVVAHGGTIGLDGREGTGARFLVRIPLVAP